MWQRSEFILAIFMGVFFLIDDLKSDLHKHGTRLSWWYYCTTLYVCVRKIRINDELRKTFYDRHKLNRGERIEHIYAYWIYWQLMKNYYCQLLNLFARMDRMDSNKSNLRVVWPFCFYMMTKGRNLRDISGPYSGRRIWKFMLIEDV